MSISSFVSMIAASGVSTGNTSALAISSTEDPNGRLRLYDFSDQDGQLDTLLDTYTQTSFLFDGVGFNGDNTKVVALRAGRNVQVFDISANTLSLTSSTNLGHSQSNGILAVAPDSDYFITEASVSGKFDLRSMSTPGTKADTYTNATNSGTRFDCPPTFSGDGSILFYPDRNTPQIFSSVSGGSISFIAAYSPNLYEVRRGSISYDGTVGVTMGRSSSSVKQIMTFDVTSSSIAQRDNYTSSSGISENSGCCLTPNGSHVFYMNSRTLTVRATDALSTVVDSLDLQTYIGTKATYHVTITSDGKYVWVASDGDDIIVEWDGSSLTFQDNVVVSESHSSGGGPVVAFSWV